MMKHIALSLLLVSSIAFSVVTEAKTSIEIPEQIAKTVDVLRTLPQAEAKKRVQAFDQLIEVLENLELRSGRELLKNSDLDEASLKSMLANSRGLYSVRDVLKKEDLQNGFSLGLSARDGQYEMLSERLGLIAWSQAYADFKIDWHKVKNHTAIFLDKITGTGAPIVFFLPNSLITYSQPSITKNEFTWLMSHPDRLKNVYFVLGGYEMVTAEMKTLSDAAGLSNDMFRALFLRALGAKSTSYDPSL